MPVSIEHVLARATLESSLAVEAAFAAPPESQALILEHVLEHVCVEGGCHLRQIKPSGKRDSRLPHTRALEHVLTCEPPTHTRSDTHALAAQARRARTSKATRKHAPQPPPV